MSLPASFIATIEARFERLELTIERLLGITQQGHTGSSIGGAASRPPIQHGDDFYALFPKRLP